MADQEEKKYKNKSSSNNLLLSSVKILSDITHRNIEKSDNFPDVQNTRTYFSNRYGVTLKRTIG